MAIPEEIETVLLFVFIVAVAPSGIPMFGLICPIGKSNRQVYDMARNIHIILFAMIERALKECSRDNL